MYVLNSNKGNAKASNNAVKEQLGSCFMKFLNNEKFTYLYEALKYWYYDTNGVIDHQNQILAIDIEVFKVFHCANVHVNAWNWQIFVSCADLDMCKGWILFHIHYEMLKVPKCGPLHSFLYIPMRLTYNCYCKVYNFVLLLKFIDFYHEKISLSTDDDNTMYFFPRLTFPSTKYEAKKFWNVIK